MVTKYISGFLTHNKSFRCSVLKYSNCVPIQQAQRAPLNVPVKKFISYSSTKSSEEFHLNEKKTSLRLSRIIALGTATSRRNAETLIRDGKVCVNGQIIFTPSQLVTIPTPMVASDETLVKWLSGTIKVVGFEFSSTRRQQQNIQNLLAFLSDQFDDEVKKARSCKASNSTAVSRTRVWLVHKLKGELVTENDPLGRSSMMERLRRGGLGKICGMSGVKSSLIPVGRLDMNTEGLIVITNDGSYARELELPKNKVHRIYRARVHGLITDSKLRAIRNGLEINGIWYKGMQVSIQRLTTKKNKTKTNTWIQITCQEGKNRQIRKIMEHLNCKLSSASYRYICVSLCSKKSFSLTNHVLTHLYVSIQWMLLD